MLVDVWHRIYYNEPTMCPMELWALAFGSKVGGDPEAAEDQQAAIERAKNRIQTTSRTGEELIDFPEVFD
ncbi:hypothetical protein SEA_BEEGEE_47 [Gordonia phage BeeGee]|nr:hypothetical protein SEA_BEEGEE_47 [Gordonia phage BeeGee]